MMQKGCKSFRTQYKFRCEKLFQRLAQLIDIISNGVTYNTKCNKHKTYFNLLFNGPIANDLNCVNWTGLYKSKGKSQMRRLNEIWNGPIKIYSMLASNVFVFVFWDTQHSFNFSITKHKWEYSRRILLHNSNFSSKWCNNISTIFKTTSKASKAFPCARVASSQLGRQFVKWAQKVISVLLLNREA